MAEDTNASRAANERQAAPTLQWRPSEMRREWPIASDGLSAGRSGFAEVLVTQELEPDIGVGIAA
jgi:hypothetical protein